QGLPALDRRASGDPAAVPDEGAGLVVAAPYVAIFRSDRVRTLPADQRREDRLRVPAGEAHPGEIAAGADDDPPLTVSQQRVLPQDVGHVPFEQRLPVKARAH